ncbi:MAG: Tim44/TimA family putative adaptor protein [Hyphomicrobiaceae bacterium]
MSGNFDIFTLVFLVLAVVIVFKLKSVLGKRSSEDDARVERMKAEQRARAAQDKVVAMPRREAPAAPGGQAEAPVAQPTVADTEAKVRNFASGDEALGKGLVAIHQADRTFDPELFVKGARQAYEMIVTAFAEGNRKLLKTLLSREVFDSFSAAISDRESRGEQIDQSFVGINKADIIEAELKKGQAQISVRFISELFTATRDKAGVVIAGDPTKNREVVDIWTFSRDTSSRDPNWRLVATQAPN